MKKWKKFKGETLPQSALDWAEKGQIFRSGYGQWIIGWVWYVGKTPETATDWMIVTDDGGYYKIMDDTGWPALYSLWFSFNQPTLSDKPIGMHCHWSNSSLLKDVRELKAKLV